jgi:hypothetical protein
MCGCGHCTKNLGQSSFLVINPYQPPCIRASQCRTFSIKLKHSSMFMMKAFHIGRCIDRATVSLNSFGLAQLANQQCQTQHLKFKQQPTAVRLSL